MPEASTGIWRCAVCGFVHRGGEAPEWCPICGAARPEFEARKEPGQAQAAVSAAAQAAVAAGTTWRCLNCGYLLSASEPAETCPVCGAPKERFEPIPAPGTGEAASRGKRRVVIAGAGIAGISAAESLRVACPEADITLLSKEDALPYYRLNLTRYLAGEVDLADFPLHPEEWYEAQRIELLRGAEVSELSLSEKEILLRDRARLPFDKLILTVGSHPFIPPIPGAHREGVFSFRTLKDAVRLAEAAREGAKCVCVGGGILGLETAAGLARRGVEAVLLESYPFLMPRQLNPEAARRLLEAYAREMGIRIFLNARIEEIVGDERAAGVRLESGLTISCDLVIITAGVRPSSHIARRAGLAVNQGLAVNNLLQTSHPDVFAAGDLAEHHGMLYGSWNASKYQGSIAGMNAGGDEMEFGGIPRSNLLKVLGLDLFSLGRFMPEDGSYLVIEGEKDGAFRRFVFHDGCLVGSVILGEARISASLKKAVEQRTDFSGLLKNRPSAHEVAEHLARQPAF